MAGVPESPQPYGERKIEHTRPWLQKGEESDFTGSRLDHGILRLMLNKPPDKGGQPRGVFAKCVLSRFGLTGAPSGSVAGVPPEAARFPRCSPRLDSYRSCQSEFLTSGSGDLATGRGLGLLNGIPTFRNGGPHARGHPPRPVLGARGWRQRPRGWGSGFPSRALRPPQVTPLTSARCCARPLGTATLDIPLEAAGGGGGGRSTDFWKHGHQCCCQDLGSSPATWQVCLCGSVCPSTAEGTASGRHG